MTSGRVKLGAGMMLGLGLVLLARCKGSGSGKDQPLEETAVTIGSENIVIVDSAKLQSGPVVSGTLEPEREANIKAQITGTVLETLVEPGQRVSAGTLLVRLEASGIREAYVSAQSAVRSAEANLDVARRNLERAERLQSAGAVADRDVEVARSQSTSAEAAVADAKSRLATAERQLANTAIRAPFTGVVSDRPVNSGDVVQTGNSLITVVDPTSMRLEASVPADQLSSVRVGAPVEFTVSGYQGQVFAGTVERVNPTVDPGTGQVRIYVTIPNTRKNLVAGLYAEGRLATESARGLAIPIAALNRLSTKPSVLRVTTGKVEEVPVVTGIRDEVAELVEIRGGLQKGDTVLLSDAQGLAPGTVVKVTPTASTE